MKSADRQLAEKVGTAKAGWGRTIERADTLCPPASETKTETQTTEEAMTGRSLIEEARMEIAECERQAKIASDELREHAAVDLECRAFYLREQLVEQLRAIGDHAGADAVQAELTAACS